MEVLVAETSQEGGTADGGWTTADQGHLQWREGGERRGEGEEITYHHPFVACLFVYFDCLFMFICLVSSPHFSTVPIEPVHVPVPCILTGLVVLAFVSVHGQ